MKNLSFILIFFCSYQSYAQIGVEEFDSNINPGVEIRTIPARKKELLGSTFLYENWTVGDIYLNSGTVLNDMPLKYDILGQDLLILNKGSLFGIKLNFVEKFNLLTSEGDYLDFVVNKEWTIDGSPGSGVYQLIVQDGDYGLIKITKVKFVKANYYVALDAGQKDDEYVQSSDFYFLNFATKVLTKVPRGKKKLIEYFDSEDLKLFIKSNRIDIKSVEGLTKIVQYVNSLDV